MTAPQVIQYGKVPATNAAVQFGKVPGAEETVSGTPSSEPQNVGIVPTYAGGSPTPPREDDAAETGTD